MASFPVNLPVRPADKNPMNATAAGASLYETLLQASLALFFIGFSFGSTLPSEPQYSFESEVYQALNEDFFDSRLDTILQVNGQSLNETELKIEILKKQEVNSFFAPIFSEPKFTARGWLQRTTCVSSPRFVRPIPTRLTSRYGRRISPFTGYTRMHTGLDYGGRMGTPIQAAETGFVHWARSKGAYGKTVMITHKNGFTSLYGHLSQYAVDEGDRVQQGQTIGYVGRTGRATGPHLHFEVRCNDIPLNPTAYINRQGKKAVVSRLFRYKPLWQRPGAQQRQLASDDGGKDSIYERRKPRKNVRQLIPQKSHSKSL